MTQIDRVRRILGDALQLGPRADALREDSRLLGAIPEFDSMAVVSVLTMIEELRLRSRKVALDHVEFGWVLEDNAGMRKPIEMSGAKIDKIHRIYERRLGGASQTAVMAAAQAE